MLFVVPETKQKQDEHAEQYNHKLFCFSEKIGWVDIGCFGKPKEAAGDEQKFYRNCGSNYNGSYSSKDCDTAAEGDNGSVVSVFSWMCNEPDALGQLSYDGC